jgi:hypothetical protein
MAVRHQDESVAGVGRMPYGWRAAAVQSTGSTWQAVDELMLLQSVQGTPAGELTGMTADPIPVALAAQLVGRSHTELKQETQHVNAARIEIPPHSLQRDRAHPDHRSVVYLGSFCFWFSRPAGGKGTVHGTVFLVAYIVGLAHYAAVSNGWTWRVDATGELTHDRFFVSPRPVLMSRDDSLSP